MDQPTLVDAVDLAMCKLRAIPSPSSTSPMTAPLANALSDLSVVLSYAESGGSASAIDRAKKQALASLTMLVLTADKTAYAKLDELKTSLAESRSPAQGNGPLARGPKRH
jgi:hypothetical protein